MHRQLPSIRLTGARILRGGRFQERSLALQQGRVAKGPFPAVDLSGYLILPGVIDMMGRPCCTKESAARPELYLEACARRAAAEGVALQYLQQGWSWERPEDSPATAEALARALDKVNADLPTSLRLALRLEHDLCPDYERILATVRRHGLDLVLFSNRAEHARALMDSSPSEFAALALSIAQQPELLATTLDGLAAANRAIPRALCTLAEAFDTLGVCYGSMEDRDGEAREHHSMIGANLCVAPKSRKAAEAARAVSDPVVWTVADVLERLDIRSLKPADLRGVDAIVSDGAAMPLSALILKLDEIGLLPLERGWPLISGNPADLLRLTDRGRLDYGCVADVTIVNERTRKVEATLSAGTVGYLSGEIALRFLDLGDAQAVAAE